MQNTEQTIQNTVNTSTRLMYVCPCVICETDERYPLDAAI